MAKQENNLIKIIAIVAVVGIAYMLFGGDGGQSPAPATFEIKTPGQPTQQQVVSQPATTTQLGATKGTFSISPTDQGGNTPTGTSSIMLLLDSSYWNTNERTTRNAITKLIADNGVNSLKYYTGASESKTHSSGTWSWTVYPKAYRSGSDIFSDDKAVLFSYFDTTPSIRENKTQAKLVSFKRFNPSTETWSASFQDGATTLKLISYAQYNITDTTANQKSGYQYADAGSVQTNKGISWQSNSSEIGAELVDGAVFVTAPKNYTNYFKSVTISAKELKSGYTGSSSVQYTSGDLIYTGFPDNIAKVINVLPAAPTSNDYVWFVGYIPEGFETERTSADSRELSWKISTDTYGTPVNTTWYIVQNAHALSGNNNAGVINSFTNGFALNYTTTAATNTGFFS